MSDTQHALPHGEDCDCYECFGRALGTLAWESLPREEAPRCVVCQQEGHTFRNCPAVPTPHSDSLDVFEQDAFVKQARRACRCLFIQVPESVARDVQMKVEAAFGSLLSRLETLTRERGAYPEVLAENEKLTVENESLYRRLSLAESENARMAEVLNPAQLRNIATGLEKVADRGYRLSADQVSEYRTLAASLVALAARASRTQSPTATTEKKQ